MYLQQDPLQIDIWRWDAMFLPHKGDVSGSQVPLLGSIVIRVK